VETATVTASIDECCARAVHAGLRERLGATAGDLLLFVADKEEVVADALGHLRLDIAPQAGLCDFTPGRFSTPTWVLDFPSFLWDKDEKRWVANHHPFTAPQDEYLDLLKNVRDEDLTRQDSPLAGVKAKAYDL